MRAVEIIEKKRDGGVLTRDEIEAFVLGFTRGEIPDYQASAWAMAVFFRGMTAEETFNLTDVMANSGERIDLSSIVDVAVDKHSTGGVGDKTTLVVEPVVAACGVPVGKMSGRGLSYTGGTLDKMESIAGFHSDLTTEQFLDQLARIGLVLSGQTADLAPADGKFYALRDVTGTVPSLPLIAASVMSKKIAGGADAIVLDVKIGVGAFMPDVAEGEKLARRMVEIGKLAGRRTAALISDMNQPLGHAVGNALEVKEALDTLHGRGPSDFRLHCLEVAANMLTLAGKVENIEAGRVEAARALEGGGALEKFTALVEAQGGDVQVVREPGRLPEARYTQTVFAPESGYLREAHAREIGMAVVELGGGRQKKGDPIDYAVGVVVHRKVGEVVEVGEPLFTVYADDEAKLEAAVQRVLSAHKFSHEKVEPLPHFYATVD